jgi:predicted acylesterase/phospholipase RssA
MSDRTASPPKDRYCDLVMKGGITSGIVYPPVVRTLAEHYRFKNIGGTSAGAIAAVATAAAEYGRRQSDDLAPFERLGVLPATLGKTKGPGGSTKLFSLFQPSPSCRRLYTVLTGSLNAGGTWSRLVGVILSFIKAYWPVSLACALLAAITFAYGGPVSAVCMGTLALLASIGFWVYRDVTRGLVANDYGMCTGMTPEGSPDEALTPWLHDLIQGLAGLPLDRPLTFGDLWGAPGFPPSWLRPPPSVTVRSIDLRMFTTNLSVGRPFLFPLTGETCRLFYVSEELGKYVPSGVMRWIDQHAKAYAPNAEEPDRDPPATAAPKGLKELPASEDFPVLLAARASLSFPVLFSAIPLWAIDYDPPRGQRGFKRCLFSDGGISSNFPVHLFDGMLPQWPTFGVELEEKLPGRPNLVYLPQRYDEGYGERWARFDDTPKLPASRMGGFLSAVVNAMQNWNDNALSRMPGVRDRIVRVRLNPDEGGLNLNMDAKIIERVADRGMEAAQALLTRFAPGQDNATPAIGWDEQRYVRLQVALMLLERRFIDIALALSGSQPHGTAFAELIARGRSEALPGNEGKLLTDEDVQAQVDGLHSMQAFSAALSTAAEASPFDAIPEPDLRVRPSL